MMEKMQKTEVLYTMKLLHAIDGATYKKTGSTGVLTFSTGCTNHHPHAYPGYVNYEG